MIEDYRGLAVFVAIADAGSLSAAGRRLKLSTSVVSHHLSRLEAKLGVTLFFRSTRSMSLTPEGHAALAPARRMVAAGEEALDAVAAGSDEPVGALRITMPAWGERMRLRQTLWDFARRHPLVAISLHSSDAPADLVKEGFDLAIRLGELADSSLKNRRIADFERVLVAAPDYLASRPSVRTLEDLGDLRLHRDFSDPQCDDAGNRGAVGHVSAGKRASRSGHDHLGEIRCPRRTWRQAPSAWRGRRRDRFGQPCAGVAQVEPSQTGRLRCLAGHRTTKGPDPPIDRFLLG